MTQARRISRRALGAGLTFSLPAAVTRSRAASQTPEATPATGHTSSPTVSSLIAVSPHDLLQMLLDMPFDEGSSILGTEFEQARWTDIGRTPYISSVGGVVIQRANADDTDANVLGKYGVYLSDDGAQAAMMLGERAIQDRIQNSSILRIGDHEGTTVTYGRDPEVLSMIPVGNVLVIASDILLNESGHTTAEAGIYRSVRYATVLLEHLDRVTSLHV